MTGEKWRIHQLQTITARALESVSYDGPNSARVRRVPDARTIRYYTTIGLIDRPAEMQGRTAFYSQRHVLQLVCIKRLQSQGHSLAEVQQKLVGATSEQLASIAELQASFWDAPVDVDPVEPSSEESVPETATQKPPARSRDEFWATAARPAANIPVQSSLNAKTCVRFPIAPGASLELEGVDLQQLTDQSIESLHKLLAKFSHDLKSLGLISGEHPKPSNAPPNESE